jgi:hypothetical protein
VAPERTVEVRYEALVSDPEAATTALAGTLGVGRDDLADAFAVAHANSVGRWRLDLTPEQLADVEDEAGDLLAELGYF